MAGKYMSDRTFTQGRHISNWSRRRGLKKRDALRLSADRWADLEKNGSYYSKEARPVARVLLLDVQRRLFLLHAEHAAAGRRFWVTPGGGVEAGEAFEDAARRELREETGLDVQIGRWVWTRRHAYNWNGRWCDRYERFFIATTAESRIRPEKEDDYVVGRRWWTLSELKSSGDEFAPGRLPELVAEVVRGIYPDLPIDCGV